MSNTPQNTTISNTLIELGLGQNEAKLYEILMKNPGATMPRLRTLSPLSRPMLYYVLQNLADFGLLTTKKDGRKTAYYPEPPEKLQDLIADQEKEVGRQKKMLTEILPDLKSFYRLATGRPGVRFFEGLAGIREATFDSLSATGEIYTFSGTEALERHASAINREYVAARAHKKIPKKIIAIDSPYAREHYRTIANSDLTKVKLLPEKLMPFKTITQIYNDSVSMCTLETDRMIGVIMEDKNISQTFKSLFEFVWATLPDFDTSDNMYKIKLPPAVPS